MASYTVVLDYTDYHGDDRVEAVTIRETTAEKYPCGYDYSSTTGRSMAKPSCDTIMPTNGRTGTNGTRRTASKRSSSLA